MALAYGAAYPAGVFIPTIAAGACLGGCCGNLLVALQVTLPPSRFRPTQERFWAPRIHFVYKIISL
jgi:hypothetical protein